MRTGRVVQFDEARGYGFIAPDQGGDDVFVHASLLGDHRWTVTAGLPVEFESFDSDRGPKARTVRVLRGAAPAPVAAARAPLAIEPAADDGGLYDVLPERAFLGEMTEVLLGATAGLTGAQIVLLRREMLAFGRRNGWVED